MFKNVPKKFKKNLVKEKIESLRIFYLLKIKIDESSSQELFSKMFKRFKKKIEKKLLKEKNLYKYYICRNENF
jgi:hypothetical protein